MNYVRLGNSGLKVSRLCLGCWTYGAPERGGNSWSLSEEKSRPLIQQALEGGIKFFDTANGYSDGSSEEILGRALRDVAPRDEIIVATKAYLPWRGCYISLPSLLRLLGLPSLIIWTMPLLRFLSS